MKKSDNQKTAADRDQTPVVTIRAEGELADATDAELKNVEGGHAAATIVELKKVGGGLAVGHVSAGWDLKMNKTC